MAQFKGRPIPIVYCSQSNFKEEEWQAASRVLTLEDGSDTLLSEQFDIEFSDAATKEPLLCDLEEMVRSKAKSAYQVVRVPCIVEHGGLILHGYERQSFPGGLTQPMWDALTPELFVSSCAALSTSATARSVIGYCDGMEVQTFVGDTNGALSTSPKGDRLFYWDTVFCPDGFAGKTYSEIVGRNNEGILDKVRVSQSIKALKAFLAYRLSHEPLLFPAV